MKELLLILGVLSVFAFGYYVMTELVRFTGKNRNRSADEKRDRPHNTHAAADSPAILGTVTAALENGASGLSCGYADYLEGWTLSSGRKHGDSVVK